MVDDIDIGNDDIPSTDDIKVIDVSEFSKADPVPNDDILVTGSSGTNSNEGVDV